MGAAEPSADQVVDAVRHDAAVARLADDLRPDPADQVRVFRGRLLESGESCVLKVGATEMETAWMSAVSAGADDIVPHVFGHGTLAPIARHWLLLADLPTRARSDRRDQVVGVMRATARFQEVAAGLDLPTYPIDEAFVTTYTRQAAEAGCPGPAEQILDRIGADEGWVRSLGGHVSGHGDVHFWNAVAATPEGPWRLIDPIPRTAHWAWDAAYAQMTSGVAETPDLITMLATERRRRRLPVAGVECLDRLRTVLLGWSSLLWWALLPARREDAWWCGQVERHVTALAGLGAGGTTSPQDHGTGRLGRR